MKKRGSSNPIQRARTWEEKRNGARIMGMATSSHRKASPGILKDIRDLVNDSGPSFEDDRRRTI
jgi:hypothetical protein